MKIDFEVILSYTVTNEITMVVKPINTSRTMPTVIVTRWFGLMTDHTLSNSFRNFLGRFVEHALSS